jgi:hypothetical protein
MFRGISTEKDGDKMVLMSWIEFFTSYAETFMYVWVA